MMKTVLNKLKKHWITVWLVIAAMIFGTFVSYAIYTEVSSVKRVVTTKSAPKVLFSSNCMYNTTYERRMPAEEFNVNVCNYDQNSPDMPNSVDINYILTAQLRVKYNGTIMTFSELRNALGEDTAAYNSYVTKAEGYSIGKAQDNNSAGIIASPDMDNFSDHSSSDYTIVYGSAEAYEVLDGGSSSIDKFKVIVPASDFEKTDPEFYVYVEAEPQGDSSLTPISTLLYGSKNIVITASWSGTLAERNTNKIDYDFYNYVITGSGSGTLDIMWDPEWFEVNDFFFSNYSGVNFKDGNNIPSEISDGEHNGWNKVTIEVNSANSGKSRYEMQLYKKKENVSYTGDNDAAKHIACELH
ncbi:MAG: hypothetical protein E7493_13335 [Ruminococcus albus]|nr:hypothetical protein [Ruminococcus albus]